MRGWWLTLLLLGGCGDPDGDGFGSSQDCATKNPDVFPGAEETCNGIDDDCDGKIDRAGGDPGCSSNTDDDERGTKECDDGIDNDVDGYRDYVAPGCGTAIGDPQCDKPDDDDEH